MWQESWYSVFMDQVLAWGWQSNGVAHLTIFVCKVCELSGYLDDYRLPDVTDAGAIDL